MKTSTTPGHITKDSLKEELKKLASKKDISKLATKAEVKMIRNDLLRLEERIESFEDGHKSLREEIKKNTSHLSRLENILVDIAGKLDDLRTENAFGAFMLKELREDMISLKKRVEKLEQTQNTS